MKPIIRFQLGWLMRRDNSAPDAKIGFTADMSQFCHVCNVISAEFNEDGTIRRAETKYSIYVQVKHEH